jgi:hypothetical protein
MKKVLSMVLVIALAFSLVTFASAKDPTATFSDGKDVKNVAAVDLLTGIGVIDGANGAFDPTGTLTREQAAKIIAYMLNGTAATNLKAITAPFSDVATTRWSAGYIAFCVEEGILNGVGNGKFNPEGKLTGFAWAKMLLCALGYDASAEEFTGGTWTINVAKTVNKVNLAFGLNIDFSANISRDDACALAYNTLTADMVEYPSTGTQIIIGDTTVSTGAGKAQAMPKASGGYKNAGNDLIMQFCELYFKDLQQKFATNFGRNGYKWVNVNTAAPLSAFYSNDVVLATSYSGVSVTNLTTPANFFYKASLNSTPVSYVINGLGGQTIGACDTAAMTKGHKVELVDVYPFEGKVDTVVVTTMTATTLPSNPVTTATSGAVTNVTVAGTAVTNKDSKYVSGYEGLAKDDVVLSYTLRNENGFDYFYIEKCKTVTGTLTAYNNTLGALTIDGTVYYDSALGTFDPSTDVTGLYGVAGVTFYLDMGGQVVKAVSPQAAFNLANYLFVKGAANTGVVTNKYEAAVTFMDGTTAVITVAKTGLATGSYAVVADLNCADAFAAAGDLADYTFYSFVKNEDGSYNLRVAAQQTSVVGATATVTAADFLSNHGLATGDTTFVYQNAQGTFNVYKGVASAPIYTIAAAPPANSGVYVLLNPTTPAYAMAAIGLGGTASGIPGDMKQVFITGAGTQHYLSGTTYYITYPAVVDGKTEQTIETVDGLILNPGNLYLVTEYTNSRISNVIDSTNVPTWQPLADLHAAVNTLTYNAGTMTVNDAVTGTTSYILASDAKVFVYNTNVIPAALTEVSADSINGYASLINGNDSVTVVTKNGATDPTIKSVFINLQTTATGAITSGTAGVTVTSGTTPKTVAIAAAAGVAKSVQFNKTANQTIAISGVGVTAGATTPTTADFSFGAAAAGTYSYTLTVSEPNYAPITYNVTVTVAPPAAATFGSATTTNATTITITMSSPLTGTVGDPAAFTIGGVASNPAVSAVTVSGATVTLTLNAAIVAGDTPTVAYTATGANNLTNGTLVANFAAQPVTNTIV